MKRFFILGDEWLYYKIYCGKRIADVILVETIKPLTEKLIDKNLIDKWFFIRYSDPDFHIRIRFHFNQNKNLGQIINYFNEYVAEYIQNDFVWKIQTDTYNREIERYGINTIEEAEELFYIDSSICLEALQFIVDEESLFIFMLYSINNLLDIFELSMEEKITFVAYNLQFFKNEFSSDKLLHKQLHKKYRSIEKDICFVESKVKQEYLTLFVSQNRRLLNLKKRLLNKTSLSNIKNLYLSSYVHMMVNRIFRDKQRLFELVCYDFLYTHYKNLVYKN